MTKTRNLIAAGLAAVVGTLGWCTYDILTYKVPERETTEVVQEKVELEKRVGRAEEVTRTTSSPAKRPVVKKIRKKTEAKLVKGIGEELFEKAYDSKDGCVPEEKENLLKEELGKIKNKQKLVLTLGELWVNYKEGRTTCQSKGMRFISKYLSNLDKYLALDVYKSVLKSDNDYFRRVVATNFFQHLTKIDQFTDEEIVKNLADLCKGKVSVFEKPCPVGNLASDEWVNCRYSNLNWTSDRVCREVLAYSPSKAGTYRNGELNRKNNPVIEEMIRRGEKVGPALELSNVIGGFTLCEDNEGVKDLMAIDSENAKDILCRYSSNNNQRLIALAAYIDNQGIQNLEVDNTLYEMIKRKIETCK